jgi:hypothetical protein
MPPRTANERLEDLSCCEPCTVERTWGLIVGSAANMEADVAPGVPSEEASRGTQAL